MTYGSMALDTELRIDFDAMRRYKLGRMQAELAAHDLGGLLCFDPDNIRYITSTAMGEWSRDKSIRWCVLPREGDPVLFELGTAGVVKRILCPWLKPENIRNSRPWSRGGMGIETTRRFTNAIASDIRSVLDHARVSDLPLGVDVVDLYILDALKDAGIKIVNGWEPIWSARRIKSKEELQCIEMAAAVVDGIYANVVDMIRPGIRESDIVANIYKWLMERGCDHITGVNCVSGARSNPHPHDYSDRMIRPGDLVFIDIIANYMGYSTCYYRTFATTFATDKQHALYKQANDWLQASIDVVKPGITTADIAAQWPTAQQLGFANEIQAIGLAVGHGLGLSNHERPFVSRAFSMENPEIIEPGMHFALETFCGDGDDGARLESQVIVTETGNRVITKWPIERLMVCHPW